MDHYLFVADFGRERPSTGCGWYSEALSRLRDDCLIEFTLLKTISLANLFGFPPDESNYKKQQI